MSAAMPQPQQQSATHAEVWDATVALKERFKSRSLPSAQIVRVKDWTLQYKEVRTAASTNARKQFFWTAPTGEVLQSSGELREWFHRNPRAAAAPSPAGRANRATFAAHTTGASRKRSFDEAVRAAVPAAPNFAAAVPAPPNLAAAAPAKKVALVGTKGGVGKSTSCKQISAAIAQQRPDKQTVVVDLDPQSHQAFRVVGTEFYPHTERGGGLFEVFELAMRMRPSQGAELGRRLAQALQPTQQPNLLVLFASNTQVKEMEVKVQANPFLAQLAWARIIELLDARFDTVFFDTAGTQTSNLLPLALSTCNLAVLVAEPHSEYSNAEIVTTADKCREVKALHNPALKVGVVLNKVDGRTSVAAVADKSCEMAGRAAEALGSEVHELGALRLSTTALKKTEADAPLALMRSLPLGGDAVLPEIRAIAATVLRHLGA